MTAKQGISAEHAAGLALLKRLRQQEKPRLGLSILAGSTATLLLILSWYFIARLIQQVVLAQPTDSPDLPLQAVLIVSLLLTRNFALYWQEQLAQTASNNIRASLRQQLLLAWQAIKPASLQQQAASSHAGHWLEDTDALDGYIARYFPLQQLMLLSPLLILVAIALSNWLVALLLLFSAPLIPLFMSLIGMGAEQINQKHLTQRQRLAGHFLDRLRKMALINRLGAAEQVEAEVASRSERYRQLVMKTLRVAFLSSAVLEFFASVAIAAVAIYIGFVLFGAINFGPAQSLTLASGIFMLALAPEFFQPLRQFAQSYHDRAAALAAATELAPQLLPSVLLQTQSLQTQPPLPPQQQNDTNNKTAKAFECRDLSVNTATGQQICRQVNINLSQGQCLLISGPSGVGKSTLLKTFAGLQAPDSGQVCVGQLTVTQARVFYLAQKPWVFNGTLRENLAVLSPDADDNALLAALSTVGLAALCSSAAQLDKPLTERAEGLSGGQLQRLALARVLLSSFDVLLLDEPTASLDLASRKQIIACLEQLKRQYALIIVSHDAELAALADQRLVLTSATHIPKERYAEV